MRPPDLELRELGGDDRFGRSELIAASSSTEPVRTSENTWRVFVVNALHPVTSQPRTELRVLNRWRPCQVGCGFPIYNKNEVRLAAIAQAVFNGTFAAVAHFDVLHEDSRLRPHPDVAFQRALTGSHSRLEELLIETFVVGVRQISWIVGSTAIVLAVLGFAATSSRWGDSRHTTTPTRAKLPFLGFNLFSLLYISLYQLFPFLT
eukprot:1182927-Prorocentrum_minimum.AAC.1